MRFDASSPKGASLASARTSIRVSVKRIQEDKGVLVLTACKFVQISVMDDGRGIPKERIGDLFNKFVQVSRTSMGEGNGYKGTGLGLSICKEIIERQQGRIWVESAAGLGTQFHFLLPQYEPIPANGQGGTYAAK